MKNIVLTEGVKGWVDIFGDYCPDLHSLLISKKEI